MDKHTWTYASNDLKGSNSTPVPPAELRGKLDDRTYADVAMHLGTIMAFVDPELRDSARDYAQKALALLR